LILFFLIPIITFSILDFEKERENKIIAERILAEQEAQKIAQENIEKNYLMGKFNPAQKENFVPIPTEYNANDYPMYLRKEALEAFFQMREATKTDNIILKIVSGTRNFDAQKYIWEGKWNGTTLADGKNIFKDFPNELERFNEILKYSAVPGTSRHHWGIEIDINNSDTRYYKTEKGMAEYTWLVKNAPLFGFCQPYTLKGSARPTGYYEEKWHWSYKPISKDLTNEYKQLIKEKDLVGFLGDQYVVGQSLIDDYVLGINSDCI
jgi:LAS superfamily LD-carboxypeptidase LdcB